MSDPVFSKAIRKRRRIVIRAIRDSCVNCIECRTLCGEHLEAARKLVVDPRGELSKWERLFFEGDGHER